MWREGVCGGGCGCGVGCVWREGVCGGGCGCAGNVWRGGCVWGRRVWVCRECGCAGSVCEGEGVCVWVGGRMSGESVCVYVSRNNTEFFSHPPTLPLSLPSCPPPSFLPPPLLSPSLSSFPSPLPPLTPSSPSPLPPLLPQVLRRQLIYNCLFTSCLGNSSAHMPIGHAHSQDYVFDLSTKPPDQITVAMDTTNKPEDKIICK